MAAGRGADPYELACRAWVAAESICALRGDDAAWHWTGRKLKALADAGRLQDPNALRRLAKVLEDRLARERGERREEAEA